ncbi:uncharacterized protein LOC116431967 [Nomia melanderi]|uniref:uncharacterized protein LOC116431967 n=1 Tax=Nomia melanderi TaxID=2448451 RepID=UPI001304057F|nr:uncharacterized protein LOC116431967 [Nomia melanderi]
MKTELLLQFTLLLTILLVTSTEGFFFEYPKKVVSNILQSIKSKVEAKRKPHAIQHYHLHYYPVVHPLSGSLTKAPKKHELEEIHRERLNSLGWSDNQYKYVPVPEVKIPLSLFNTWDDNEIILETDLSETINHVEDEGVLVQVPYNQKIIIENDHSSDLKKLKHSLVSSLLNKILKSKHHVHP